MLDILAGGPQELILSASTPRDGGIELSLDVPLLDPFDKLNKISFLYGLGALARQATPERARFIVGPLPGATKIELKIGARRARGSIAIPAASAQDVELAYQFRVEDAEGRAHFTRPGRYFVGAIPNCRATGDCGGDSTLGDVIDPDGDCKIKLGNGRLSLEIPGTLHDLTTELNKVNAPPSSRKSREISSRR